MPNVSLTRTVLAAWNQYTNENWSIHVAGPMADHLLSHKCPTPYKQNILTNNSCEDENADKEVDGDKQVFDVLE